MTELTTEPTECLAPPADEADARARAIGRAAFRAPGLLGGQAARAGLSCAACHRNGRGNPAFSFPGVSGEPGTADVTSSFFSSHRGDNVANPAPIPDLAGPRDLLKVDRRVRTGALETFIRGLIVEEFDGAEPPAAVLAGLAAYVRGLDPGACPVEERQAVTLDSRIADVRAAVDAAAAAYAVGDGETADLLLGAARAELGRMHERFAGSESEPARAALTADSELLGLAQRSIQAGRGGAVVMTLVQTWRTDLDEIAADLQASEPRSLYAPDVLSRALAESGPE